MARATMIPYTAGKEVFVDYQRYLSSIRRYLPLIIILAMLGAGASAAFALRQPRVYKSTVTLLINPAAPTSAIAFLNTSIGTDPRSATQDLADTYEVYLHSSTFDQQLATYLNASKQSLTRLDMAVFTTDPEVLGNHLSSSLIGSTNFWQINAIANDAAGAQAIANGAAVVFIQQNLVLQKQLNAETAIQSANQTQIKSLQGELSQIQNQIQRLRKRPRLSPTQQTVLTALYQQQTSVLAGISTLTTPAAAASGGQLNTAKITSPAGIPHVPISPTLKKDVAYGTIAGLVIGLLLALVLDSIDDAIRTPEDVERATGVVPLAVIGIGGRRHAAYVTRRLSHTPANPAGSLPYSHTVPFGENSTHLYALENPNDVLTEAFRNLRTNLAFSGIEQPIRTLVITSMVPGEGKTTIASNLAVVLAQSGKQVILVDTDLRRPSLHQLFGLSTAVGVTDLLLGSTTVAASLQTTQVPNLRVITSGALSSNPAELLSFPTVMPLIEELSRQADMVLFDTPPMAALTDPVVLSTRVEGTLLVVRSGTLRSAVVLRGLEALHKVGARPLGTVLNMVDTSSFGQYAYYSSQR